MKGSWISRMKTRIAFMVVHFVVFTAIIVFLAYGAYPDEMGAAERRSRLLRVIYDEVNLYKQEKGAYPETLKPLLQFDQGLVLFRSKRMGNLIPRRPLPDNNDIHKIIHFQLINNEPVISDLGMDANEGGLGFDMDIAYPPQYQKRLSFRDFTTTKAFGKSLGIGLLFSGGVSACLLGMWAKRYETGQIPFYVIVLSILFVLFELFLLQFILYGHIYPHH